METDHAGKTIAGVVSRCVRAVSACLPSPVVAPDKHGAMVGFMRPVGQESDLKGHISSKRPDDPDKTRAPRSPGWSARPRGQFNGYAVYGQSAQLGDALND